MRYNIKGVTTQQKKHPCRGDIVSIHSEEIKIKPDFNVFDSFF